MDPAIITGIILLTCIVLGIAFSVPIAVVIGGSAFLAAIPLLGLESSAMAGAQQMFAGINSFPLLAIPLFVLAGVIMNTGGIAGRLIDAAKVLAGRMPASLAQTNILANGLFGAVSGAAVASAAAVGTVTQPRLAEEGYDRRFGAAVNVASAPAGMLIPPSNTFIVYSLVSGTSIAALFVAGVIPGILWLLACMAVVFVYALRQPGRLRSDQRVSLGQGLAIIGRAVPSLLMIIVVVGGILGGFFTATESAAIAVLYCLVLSAFYRTVRWQDMPQILVDAGRTTAIIMLLVGASAMLGFVMSFSRIPEAISSLVLEFTDSRVIVLLLMMIVLLAIGTFMDPTPAILIFVPIFLPIATEFGIDPVHFGVMVVMSLSVGVITPPVGNVLFVGARVARQRIESVVLSLWPFLLAILAALFLVVFAPVLSTWLPELVGLMD